MKKLLFLLIGLLSVATTFAQDDEEIPFLMRIHTQREGATIPGAEIKVYEVLKGGHAKALFYGAETKLLKKYISDKRGEVDVELAIDKQFKVEISKKDYLTMFAFVDGARPKTAKYRVDYMVSLYAELISPKDTTYLPRLDLFSDFPFAKYHFDKPSNEYHDDKQYHEQFRKGILPPDYLDALLQKEKEDKAKKAAELKAQQEKELAAKEADRKNKDRTVTAKLMTGAGNKFPLSKADLVLMDETSHEIHKAKTNSHGKFSLKHIKMDHKYKLIITVPAGANGSYIITNRFENPLPAGPMLTGNQTYEFVANQPFLDFLETGNNNTIISGNLVVTDANGNTQSLANAKVSIFDNAKKLVQLTHSNELGGFVFNNLDPDQSYYMEVEAVDPSMVAGKKVQMVNKAGKTVFTVVADGKGKVQFQLLASDEVNLALLEADETDIKLKLKGKILIDEKTKKPLANAKVAVQSREGKVLQAIVTDENGVFVFINLPTDQSYVLAVDENDPQLSKTGKIYIADMNNNVIQAVAKNSQNKFNYEMLPSDVVTLGEVYEEDPWLDIVSKDSKKKVTSIDESITFPPAQSIITEEAHFILDKVVQVMKAKSTLKIEIGSHSDSNGPSEYNMDLSKKRANSAMEYMVKKGIPANRLVPVGYGETKIKNHCKDGVPCSDVEHAANRRIEFKILAQ